MVERGFSWAALPVDGDIHSIENKRISDFDFDFDFDLDLDELRLSHR
jgi:hypothetical protein